MKSETRKVDPSVWLVDGKAANSFVVAAVAVTIGVAVDLLVGDGVLSTVEIGIDIVEAFKADNKATRTLSSPAFFEGLTASATEVRMSSSTTFEEFRADDSDEWNSSSASLEESTAEDHEVRRLSHVEDAYGRAYNISKRHASNAKPHAIARPVLILQELKTVINSVVLLIHSTDVERNRRKAHLFSEYIF